MALHLEIFDSHLYIGDNNLFLVEELAPEPVIEVETEDMTIISQLAELNQKVSALEQRIQVLENPWWKRLMDRLRSFFR